MISFNARLFAVASLFTASDDSRYYLQAVHVEPMTDGGALLVATDGHRLICIFDESAKCAAVADLVVPEAVSVLAANAMPCACGECDVPCAKIGPARRLDIDDAGIPRLFGVDGAAIVGGVADCRIKANYPAWRKVVPSWLFEESPPQHPPAIYNGKFLGTFGEAARILSGGDHPGIFVQSGGDPNQYWPGAALIRFSACSFAFGLLMPMRGTIPTLQMPSEPAA